jgi:hypothetical protein
LYGTVLPNFRMWYSSYNREGSYTQVLYAEGPDGLSWYKPNLDGHGSNALFDGQHANMVSVVNTPHDLERPYKLMAYQSGEFNGFWSMDGLQTQPYTQNPLMSIDSDVAQYYWDPNTSQYRGTAKGNEVVGGISEGVRFFGRAICLGCGPDAGPDDLDDQPNSFTPPCRLRCLIGSNIWDCCGCSGAARVAGLGRSTSAGLQP